MNRYWGINAFGHDASLCVIENNKVLFHKLSGDEYLNQNLINEALSFGEPELICYYEKPFLKRLRQGYSGEWNKALSLLTPKLHLMEFGIYKPIKYISHHESHAAASYFTSDFNDALILVADAIGEWDTVSVWKATNNNLTKLDSYKYPFSLGLFYTAFSKLYGKTENEFMNLSTKGEPLHYNEIQKFLYKNLHKGVEFECPLDKNIPASVQRVFVDKIKEIIKPFSHLSNNLIMSGGCAYNKLCVNEINANVTINPGDSSSSIGAVAAFIKQKITRN
jgi:carbamoyltransferase